MMKLGVFKSLVVISIITLAWSCSRDESPEPIGSYTYFPLQEGMVRVYKVDSYNYEKLPIEVKRFWLKEETGPVVEGLNGEPFTEIYVFRKNSWNGDWQKIRTDLARNTDESAERYIENVNYVKLAYPISLHSEWNYTPFNDVSYLYDASFDFSRSHIVKAHDYQIVGDRGFDSTLHVVYYSSSERNRRILRGEFRERYANHVGLYKKIEVNADFQPDPTQSDTTGNYTPIRGYKYIQTLVDFKNP